MADPLRPFGHGGEIFQTAREMGISPADLLDFSASINPLGMPEGVFQAARQGLEEAIHYPESDASSLTLALSRFHDLSPEHLLPGSGSTELFYLFARVLRPRRALVVAPAFCEYEKSLLQAGADLDFFILRPEESFHLDPQRLLHALSPDTDLVLFANPANPTGIGIDALVVERIARAVREQALLVVDEAFADFCPRRSVIDRVSRHENLYVFRSLTKFYAIPGLRSGYLAGPPRGISRLAAEHPPWSISTVALAASRACLAEKEYRGRTDLCIADWRGKLREGLGSLGFTVFPGEANYLLSRLEKKGRSVSDLAAGLRRKGILIRECRDFHGLDERYFRVAVRTGEENQRLLHAIRELLSR